MGWTGFKSLVRSEVDVALKNDLRDLDRYLYELNTRISLLTKEEPIGSAQDIQGGTSLASHAATHSDGGSDSIAGLNFTWTGTLDFSSASISFASEQIPLAALVAGAEGRIMYVDSGGNWVELEVGTLGQALQTNGVGAAPSWVTPSTDHILDGGGADISTEDSLVFDAGYDTFEGGGA